MTFVGYNYPGPLVQWTEADSRGVLGNLLTIRPFLCRIPSPRGVLSWRFQQDLMGSESWVT
jgi:hypothetical protein